MFHELSHNIDGLLQSAEIKLEEVWVSQFLHHLGLLDKVIHLHGPCKSQECFVASDINKPAQSLNVRLLLLLL